MKKILLFVSTLIFVAACAAPPTNNEVVTNRNSATESAPPAITEADAIAKEKAIWEAIKNKDYDAFTAMLASDQIEVLPEGVMDKAASVEGVKLFEPSEVAFSDWKFLAVDKDAFVIAYTVAVKAKFQGKELKPESVRASSAWVYRDKKWLAIYHQECPVRTAPPASGAAKPTTSPTAGTATAAAGPDAIANEKAVWDALKAKNYDAFASMLAADQLEVEPVGFFDKAGTVKGVAMFDASKAILSDWKSVKLNDGAMLVTYTVNGPGFAPEGERHTTIWAKRDEKWMAVFHHGGTVVRKPVPPPPASPSPAAKVEASPAAGRSPAKP